MMSKILVMPNGYFLAHVSRSLEIAKYLREIGHEVIFASEGNYMELVQENEFPVLSVKTLEIDRILACSRQGRVNWYDYDLVKTSVEAELKLFEQIKPDLVLSSFRLTLKTSCELASLPLAVILNSSWTNFSTVRNKAPEHSQFTKILGQSLASLIFPWGKEMVITLDILPFKKFRQEAGLSPGKNLWDIWQGDLNLISDIPEYGPTKNLPSNFYYIGPIIWEPNIEMPYWFEQIDSQKPTIYITMGSTGNPYFFEQAIDIFGDSDYQFIMTTAGLVKLTNIPKNFFVTEYAPGSLIMQKSDLVICQGGNGTIYQAMSQGLPIIGIPTSHDQEFNMNRVVDLGIGIQLSELKFKPSHLIQAVEKIFNELTYRETAQKFEKILGNYNASQKGAQIIDQFLT